MAPRACVTRANAGPSSATCARPIQTGNSRASPRRELVKKRELHPEEKELWRRVVRTVKPRRPEADCSPASGGAVSTRSGMTEGAALPPSSSATRKPLPPQAGEEKKRTKRD